MSEPSANKTDQIWGRAITALMLLATIVTVVTLGAVGVTSLIVNDNGGGGSSTKAPTVVHVELAEFSITLSPSTIPPGPVQFEVHNGGSMEHNIAVKTTSIASANIGSGASATVTGDLDAGDYTIICTIAGHEAAGMASVLTVDPSASAVQPTDTTMPVMSNEQMDAAMKKVGLQFVDPASKSGVMGNQDLEYTLDADGYKVFQLEAKVVDWQLEPGKIVKAWTYNGTVPGPVIRVAVGDKVRIVLKNSLDQSTSLHLHGVRVPNAMDGVDPYTQEAQKPGETMTYEFTALEPAIGMYHSHHNAQVQVPNGMAGALIIGDWKDIAMNVAGTRLPDADGKVDQEQIMVLNDAGTIGLSLNGKSFPGTDAYTMNINETMLVHYYNEGLMTHPMHLHQPHGLVVAHDGMPLETPFWADTLNVAPGERWSVLYTAVDPGVWAWHCHILTHAETATGMKYMVTAVIVTDPNAPNS